MAFTYTDEEWASVATKLPDGSQWVRQLLEFHGNNYVQQVKGGEGRPGRSYKRSQAAWKRIAMTATKLRSDIDIVGQHPLEIIYAFDRADRDQLASFVSSLPWFIDRADGMISRLEKWDAESQRRSNHNEIERDQYLDLLLHE